MMKTNADGNLCVYMSYSNLEIGKAYTLSGYIRSSGNVQVNLYITYFELQK